MVLDDTDVSGALGGFIHRRSYSNQLGGLYDGPNGNNWVLPDWPYLVQDGSDIVYVKGRTRVWFNSSLVAQYGQDDRYSLSYDAGAKIYTLTKTEGGVETFVFHDFTQLIHPKGWLKEMTDAYGEVTTVHAYEGNAIKEMRRTEGGTLWSLHYTFYPVGNHTNRIQYALLRKSTDGGSNWTDIRRANYTYHKGNTSYGSRNDLETVTVQWIDGSTWKDASKTYYRWYTPGSANGFEGGLKYVVGPAAYAEMLADSLAPETASDSQVAGYADHYFEYDSATRAVTKEVATDCAGCGDGSGTGSSGETFTRTESVNEDGYNSWKWKVVMAKANGNVQTVYTNYLGQVMLKELKESASSDRRWITYTKFGSAGGATGKKIEMASPAAVIDYDDTRVDLGVVLDASFGLITYTTYGDETTADGETLGDALGYVKQVMISNGSLGARIVQNQTQYKTSTNTMGEKTIVPGKTTVYTDDAGTDPIQTSYAYQWHTPGSGVLETAMKERVTTLPVVSACQHGTGEIVTTKQYYDDRGRITFSQDERGIVTKNTYNPGTGELLKTQVDVDQSESGMPTGWTVGGSAPHLHVTTDYEYDDLGRTVQVLGQEHAANPTPGISAASLIRHATWMVYIEGVSSDQTWTAQGYRTHDSGSSSSSVSWSSSSGSGFTTDVLVNPVTIAFTDKNGRTTDQIQSKRSMGSGKLTSSDTFLRADWSRWSTMVYSTTGLLEYERTYHTIPSQSPDLGLAGVMSDPGAVNANYEETHYGYDGETNLRVRTLTPGGTITRTVYDTINRMSSTWVGTDDGLDWKQWNPASPGTNMKKITENVYDDGSAGGNSNVTLMRTYADDSNVRETGYAYDFRNRQISTTDPIGRVDVPTYDNLNRITQTQQYDGDPNTSGVLIGKSESSFDDLGRVYQTKQYAVNPDAGMVGNALIGQSWHDNGGNEIISIAPGDGEVKTVSTFDNLNRVTSAYTGYEVSGSDVVVAQQDTSYNKISQVLDTTDKQRDTDTPASNPTFRTSYSAMYYDGIGRSIVSAAYGTNGGSSWSRSSAIPARSDDVLVSTTEYDEAGEAFSSTDPKGIENRTVFDDMGRVTIQIDNYKASSSGADESRATEYTYNADSMQETITAKMTASSDDEVTIYVYGVTSGVGGSGINANHVLSAIQYPNDTTSQRIDLKVNRLGEVIEYKDQNGTVHEYAYDDLGRLTIDTVSTVGSGVDSAIRRMTTTYTTRDQPDTLTSYSTTSGVSGVVNQSRLDYNDFGQLVADYQAHDGMVDAATTPKVQYAFASGSSGSFETNQIRPTGMTYPGGRQINYDYGVAGSGTDLFNRIHAIKDGSTNLVEYKYLGGAVPIVADYTQPNIRLDLWGQTVGRYDGLDQFGRVVDQKWENYAGSPIDAARFEYGYDRNSQPNYRRDTVAHTLDKIYDELYTRDGLNRLNNYQRGLLNSGNTAFDTLSFEQDWSLDQVANWTSFDQDDTGNGTDDLVQTRTHNKANEITGITNTTGSVWSAPVYENAGNTTKMPKPEAPGSGFTATYDAWNRLSTLCEESTGTKVAEYTYDARGMRIRKQTHNTWGIIESTTDYYYTAGWQCVEETTSGTGSSSSSSSFSHSSGGTITTYVWGLLYIDDLASRDSTSSGGGTTRYYALSDRQYNITAIVNASGTVLERYAYTAYGQRTVLDGFYNTRSDSLFNQQHGFQGLRHDYESGLIENRNRMLHLALGRFLQRDPLGYPDGMNMYAAYHVMWGGMDPEGMEAKRCRRDAFRIEVGLTGRLAKLKTVLKKIGVHDLKFKLHWERKECAECCRKTDNKDTFSDVSITAGWLLEAELGSKEFKLGPVKIRAGWYGRIRLDGGTTVGRSKCNGSYGGGCAGGSAEAGLIGDVKAWAVSGGGRIGLNVSLSTCFEMNANTKVDVFVNTCASVRGRFWAKAWRLEYHRQWTYKKCTGKTKIHSLGA
ncbi:MAG: RHS repeat-associated core domain-containing protein [Planctomycetota bacterium]